MVIDFGGDVKKVYRVKNCAWFVDVTTWTRPAFGVCKEAGDTSLYLGVVSISWSRKPRPVGLDTAVGTVKALLTGEPPKAVFLGERLRSRMGLRMFFDVNAKNWR